jgi:iron(III) transport system ATP-binding protein
VAELLVRGVSKAFGAVRALAEVSLTVPSGSLTAVLGPSGCGKTTLLRCVAGFEAVDSGEIAVAGRSVTAVPAHRRRIAVVPQEGALFPHLTVADNVAYGLSRAERRSGRADEVLSLVGLAGFQARMPHQLSGGQQQRVAVARALAPRPPLLLLDEPFTALDAALRVELRRDVTRALRADGATAVLVTHDQGEALSIADQVAVMRAGVIVQSGPPSLVYTAPVDSWVATFVGEAVLLTARIDDRTAHTALGGLPLANGAAASDGRTVVMIRPEQLELLPATEAVGVPATVVRHDYHGHDSLVSLRLADGSTVTARILGTLPAPTPDTPVRVRAQGTARAVPVT